MDGAGLGITTRCATCWRGRLRRHDFRRNHFRRARRASKQDKNGAFRQSSAHGLRSAAPILWAAQSAPPADPASATLPVAQSAARGKGCRNVTRL